jgi:predicted ArsR family transcriptional regulator
MEIVNENQSEYHFRVTRCVFYELFNFLKVSELTSIMCSVDNAIFNTYLPDVLFFHRNGFGNTIYSGKEYCEFIIEQKNYNS